MYNYSQNNGGLQRSPAMEAMCPDPENSQIPVDQETRGPRKWLKNLYHGQYAYIVIKAMVLGPLAFIFQLIFLWILYITYATMNFCQCMLLGIFFFIEVLQTMSIVGSPKIHGVLALLAWSMLIYNLVGLGITWRAYWAFSTKFNQMHGGYQQQSQPYGGNNQASQQQNGWFARNQN